MLCHFSKCNIIEGLSTYWA